MQHRSVLFNNNHFILELSSSRTIAQRSSEYFNDSTRLSRRTADSYLFFPWHLSFVVVGVEERTIHTWRHRRT